mgnify:CR=1 FL=1
MSALEYTLILFLFPRPSLICCKTLLLLNLMFAQNVCNLLGMPSYNYVPKQIHPCFLQASVFTEDNLGRQCLHICSQTGSMSCLHYLIQNCSVDPAAVCEGNQASGLHIAAKVRTLSQQIYTIFY